MEQLEDMSVPSIRLELDGPLEGRRDSPIKMLEVCGRPGSSGPLLGPPRQSCSPGRDLASAGSGFVAIKGHNKYGSP